MLRYRVWALLLAKILQLLVLHICFEAEPGFDGNAIKHTRMHVKALFGQKPLEAKSAPTAFSICFTLSSHTLHASRSKSNFGIESNKIPFLGTSGPSGNPLFQSHQTNPFDGFLYLFLLSFQTRHLLNSEFLVHILNGTSPKNVLGCH